MLGKRRLYRLGLCGLALAMGVQTGCLQFIHPVDPLPKEEVQDQFEIPAACKNGVYVFFLQGLDPLELSNLGGVHDYVRSLGYIKTYYGQPYHAFYYEKEIVAIRARDPKARFVLIGFSYGAGIIRDLACGLGKQDIDIDLVVYIDGVRLDKRPLFRPTNVVKVVNILARDRGDDLLVPEAENLRHEDVYHYGTVTHPRTLRMLVHELGEIALRVPVITHIPSAPPGVILPAPELLHAPKPTTQRGDWDFLKPDAHSVGMPGAKPLFDAVNTDPATLGRNK